MSKMVSIKNLLDKVSNFNDYNRFINYLIKTTQKNKIIVISFLNANAVNLCFTDSIFFKNLKKSEILLLDGFGVYLAFKVFNLNSGINMNGTDLIPFVLKKFKKKKLQYMEVKKK